MTIDVDALIIQAKLGAARKEAQIDTCTVFAAALYDVLREAGIDCAVATAEVKGRWAHAVVRVGPRYFDSKGEFSTAIYCVRSKIHKSVVPIMAIKYSDDAWGPDCDSDFAELHTFFKRELNRSLRKLSELKSQTVLNLEGIAA